MMSADVGELMLERVKGLHGCSIEDLDKVGCVLLECGRTCEATRVAHRSVLEVRSEFFCEEIAKLRQSRDASGGHSSNTLRLDASADIVDIMLEYFYTTKLGELTGTQVVEAYAAAKRFGLSELEVEVATFLQTNINSCLNDDHFLDASRCRTDDIESLIDVFGGLRLGAAGRLKLMCRIRTWSLDDTDKMETALKALDKLLFPLRASDQQANASGENAAMIAGFQEDTGDLVIMALPSMVELWNGGHASTDELSTDTVAVNGHLYIPRDDKLCVRPLASNSLTREIAVFNGQIVGRRVVCDEVFFFTRDSIYVLDSKGESCTKVAQVVDEDFSENRLAVIKFDSEELVIAVSIDLNTPVRQLTFSRADTEVKSSVDLLTAPWHLTVIGSHDGLLYFATTITPPHFYVAYRGAVEVARYPIENCISILDALVCNGRLYLVYMSGNLDKLISVCGIDLSTNETIFETSYEELNMTDMSVVPLVTKSDWL